MKRPLLLDLYCGAGGASMGYYQAGFDVIGVDINPQPHYPFKFRRGNALDAWRLMRGRNIAAVHASPPCQIHSQSTQSQRRNGYVYEELIYRTRDMLADFGIPYVIENVPGAPVRPDYVLCGCNFGLNLRRKRWFETNWNTEQVTIPCDHSGGPVVAVCGHGSPARVREALGYTPNTRHYRAAMGIGWMNRDELSLAIPPAYTKFIGTHLISRIEHGNKAA